MNLKTIIISLIGLTAIFVGLWGYQKVDQFFKIDSCLDNGGRWNYDTEECENNDPIDSTITKSSKSPDEYNQFADEQNRRTYTISEFNTDLESTENIERPVKSEIINPTVDTTQLFKIWTLDPDGPHADFWIRKSDFYIVDYDGDGAMPYILQKDSLTIYYNDFIKKGKILSVNNDSLKIQWSNSDRPTGYSEWKN